MKPSEEGTLSRLSRVKARHAKLKSLQRCLNSSLDGKPSKLSGRVHGDVFRGGRCLECWQRKLAGERNGVQVRF